MLPDGSCCDGFSPTGKCNSCEYIFHICISDAGAKPCSLCNFRTEHAPGETILFESEIMTKPFGDTISNPWQLSVTKWNVRYFFFWSYFSWLQMLQLAILALLWEKFPARPMFRYANPISTSHATPTSHATSTSDATPTSLATSKAFPTPKTPEIPSSSH